MRKIFRFIRKIVIKLFRIDRQLNSLQNQIKELQELAGQQTETTTRQTKDIARQNTTITRQNKTIARQNTTITRQNKTIAQHTETISKQYESINKQYESIVQHTEAVNYRDKIIAQHTETINKQYESIMQHTEAVNYRDKTIAQCTKVINQQTEELEALKIINAELSPYKKMADVICKMNGYNETGDRSLIEQLKYNDLFDICDIFGVEIYKSLIQEYFRHAERELAKCEKICVGFMFTLPHIWGFDSLYWEMEKHERFEPYVIVMPPYDMPERYTYEGNVQIASDKGYRIIETFDPKTNEYLPFLMKEKLQIVFHQMPYALYPSQYTAEGFPLNILNVYVSYGITNTNIKSLYHLPAYRCYWKNLCETDIHIKVNGEILELGNFNAVRCGIPRIDLLYNGTLPSGSKEKRFSIIWAPHHTVPSEGLELPVSTFDWNKDFFLEYAASHPETYWYIRPHPLLCSRSVSAGLFENEHEYCAYLAEWEALNNAELALDRDSLELFALSDMMITDCVSFMTDYLFFKKPMLRLNRGEHEGFWNEYGRLLMGHVATVRGDDFEAIEAFIDAKPPGSEIFFEKHLNYYKQNGNKTSAQYFVEHIEGVLRNASNHISDRNR